MIRDFAWDDYRAVCDLWQITARSALPEDELRATLDHGPNLLLVAEDRDAAIVGVVLGTLTVAADGSTDSPYIPTTGATASPPPSSPSSSADWCRAEPPGSTCW